MNNYRHFCWDWDGLEIDETSLEFTVCMCYTQTSEMTAIKDALRIAYMGEEVSKND